MIVGDPPDRRDVKWTFSPGPPAITPGREFTITITGSANYEPPAWKGGLNYSAGVRGVGLDVVAAQNAYFYMGKEGTGKFTFKLKEGAKSARVEFWADNSAGTFALYIYGGK